MNVAIGPSPSIATARAPAIRYTSESLSALLADTQTLAVFGYGDAAPEHADPRYMRVALEPVAKDAALLECWRVAGEVERGQDDALRWASGAGWLFVALDVCGEACAAAQFAYERLGAFLRTRPECHVQRLWNYLGDINHGDDDDERYKAFCVGRARGMGELFAEGYPAATAIGHRSRSERLQVYCLASEVAGERIENPRQISAWRYPRQYGPTPPSFARAMMTPQRDALAISGTASIVGHQSQHVDDLGAQLDETFANIQALLRSADLDGGLDQRTLLKVYVRQAEHVAAVQAYVDAHAPLAQRLLLVGDICRHELLVEIDGWRYAELSVG